jgi:putative flippase GtrA
VNYGVYAALVHAYPLVREWPVLGVAAGAGAGLVVNYLSSRFWVFRQPPPRDA